MRVCTRNCSLKKFELPNVAPVRSNADTEVLAGIQDKVVKELRTAATVGLIKPRKLPLALLSYKKHSRYKHTHTDTYPELSRELFVKW